MRFSRSSVGLLGAPGRGRGLLIHNCKLHQLHQPRSHPRPHPHPHSHSHSPSPFASVNRNASRRHVHVTGDRPRGPVPSTPSSPGYVPGPGHYVPGEEIHARDKYGAALESLLAALREGNILKLYFCLLDLTRGAHVEDQLFCDAVQSIPATTFSEILRGFDPVNVSNHVDSAPGIRISYGAAIFTPLGELINKWGIKVLYVQILNRLRLIQRARLASYDQHLKPVLSDYAFFIKCAGAASNVGAAQALWYEMKQDGYADWSHAGLYAEFLKARYLTEALYANNDLARLRLRPLDMYRSTISLPNRVVKRLQNRVSSTTQLQKHRFGQNVNEPYFAEPLTRILRKRRPLARLERKVIMRHMIPGDERLACALLKANGRNGRIRDSIALLRGCWNILVTRDKESGACHIDGGADFPPGSARAPTEALLDAVVHCFANMGEISVAVSLVDFISRRFNVPVPDKVWSDLLDFARIMQTKPAAMEWAITRFNTKIAKPDTILDIWEICTQEPYNFRPGMRDYHNLCKCLIGSHRQMSRPLEAIRQIRPLYDEAVQQLQDAWLELILTTRQGVPNHAVYRRYRVAQSRKHYMWYCFHYTAKQMLKQVKPNRVDDHNGVRHIPDLIGEFGPFMPSVIKYLIATGEVELRNDSSRHKPVEIKQVLEQPRPLSERNPDVETKQDEMEMVQDREEGKMLADDEFYATEEQRDRQELFPPVQDGQPAENADVVEEEGMEDEDEDGMAGEEELDERVVEGPLEPGKDLYDAFEESRSHQKDSTVSDENEGPDKHPVTEMPASGDPSADPLRSRHQETSNANSTAHPSDEWDKKPIKVTSGRTRVLQLVERPAYMFRPRVHAPEGELSMAALRRDKKEFLGYHDDPVKAHFAAHRVYWSTLRDVGLPVDLCGAKSKRKLMKHMLWMKM